MHLYNFAKRYYYFNKIKKNNIAQKHFNNKLFDNRIKYTSNPYLMAKRIVKYYKNQKNICIPSCIYTKALEEYSEYIVAHNKIFIKTLEKEIQKAFELL